VGPAACPAVGPSLCALKNIKNVLLSFHSLQYSRLGL